MVDLTPSVDPEAHEAYLKGSAHEARKAMGMHDEVLAFLRMWSCPAFVDGFPLTFQAN